MTPRDRIDRYSTAEVKLEVPQVEPFRRQGLNQRDQRQNVSRVRQGVEGSIINTIIRDNDDNENEMDEQ